MGSAPARSVPAVTAFLLALLITAPIADGVFQIPVQVSDSLEAISIAVKYPSSSKLLADSIRFSPTTFRPLRYLQSRWLLRAADVLHVSDTTMFRTVHVALLLTIVVLFVVASQVRDWIDLAAFSVAFPVLIGIHTFITMLLEAFPVNHFAEVGACALAVLVALQRPARWFTPIVVCILMILALSVIESGAMVWVVIACCAAAGMRGATRPTVVAATLLFAAYLLLRHSLGISSPGIGGHGSGFGDTFYSPEELERRFGTHPLGFMLYNVTGGLASLLFAEPRQGVYSLLMAWRARQIHPVVVINVFSSLLTTVLIAWYAWRCARAGRSRWTDRDRMFVAACGAFTINAAFNAAYMKDEIMSVGGLLYAIAAFVALRGLFASLPDRRLVVSMCVVLIVTATTGLWAFRAVGVHYQLRYDAFKIRNDWIEVLRPDKRDDWPRDPAELAVTERLRTEAIDRRTASPSFMPRWAERYWIE
jgi:hypothetical protein